MTTAVVVPVDLEASFHGAPSPLRLPFGPHPNLLQATLERLLALEIGPIVVVAREGPSKDELARLVGDLAVQVRSCSRDALEPQMIEEAFEATSAPYGIVVDARAPFVSGTVLRAQLDALGRDAAEIALCPLAARGLSGVAIARGAFPLLRRLYAGARALLPEADLLDIVEKFRPAFAIADARVDERFTCLLVEFVARTPSDIETLGRFALPAASEEYDTLFESISNAEWSRWKATSPIARLAGAARSRPKLLFSCYTGNRTNGTIRAIETILENWDASRFEVVVAAPYEGEFTERMSQRYRVAHLPIRGFYTEHDAMPPGRWVDELQCCMDILRQERPDAVYVAGWGQSLGYACRSLGIPTLNHMHAALTAAPADHFTAAGSRLTWLALFDLLVAPTQHYEERVRALFRVPRERITTVYNGIDLQRFNADRIHRADARDRLALPRDATIISVAGYLSAFKKPHLAIEALPELLRDVPDALVVFAGAERTRGERDRLSRLATELGVLDRVRFLGFVEDTPMVYAAADVHLHCGMGETFGLVVVEAMAMERPVVAFDSLGPADTIIHGQTGLLVPPVEQASGLARALAKILADPDLKQAMGRAGRLRATRDFGARLCSQRLETLFERLITPPV